MPVFPDLALIPTAIPSVDIYYSQTASSFINDYEQEFETFDGVGNPWLIANATSITIVADNGQTNDALGPYQVHNASASSFVASTSFLTWRMDVSTQQAIFPLLLPGNKTGGNIEIYANDGTNVVLAGTGQWKVHIVP